MAAQWGARGFEGSEGRGKGGDEDPGLTCRTVRSSEPSMEAAMLFAAKSNHCNFIDTRKLGPPPQRAWPGPWGRGLAAGGSAPCGMEALVTECALPR